MNRVFKVVWNKARNCYMVVSELAKRKTKSPSLVKSTKIARLSLAITVMLNAGMINADIINTANAERIWLSKAQKQISTEEFFRGNYSYVYIDSVRGDESTVGAIGHYLATDNTTGKTYYAVIEDMNFSGGYPYTDVVYLYDGTLYTNGGLGGSSDFTRSDNGDSVICC